MEIKTSKKISCKRCQQRKIRCSRSFPCISCTTAGAECEYREHDAKRQRISRDYVAALEERVASLEAFLTTLKSSTSQERDLMVSDIAFWDHLPLRSDAEASHSQHGHDSPNKADQTLLQQSNEGSLIYYGPTSMYVGDISQATEQPHVSLMPPFTLIDRSSIRGHVISQCLGLFFHWQSAQFMFIDRTAFCVDYMSGYHEQQFCSPALVYSICAIGALMSPDPLVKQTSESFATSAQNLLLAQGLGVPHLTSVQALLCCAFYQVGKGNFSQGWLYSGLAFRMGQDLGFQRDPKHWSSEDMSSVSSPSNETRRRVYWGCFVSDKIFSLLLGRPTLLHENDADVATSTPLPQDPTWDNWLEAEGLSHLKDKPPLLPRLTLVLNQQVELGKIIQEILSRMFAPKEKLRLYSNEWTEVTLQELNSRFRTWHEALPAEMRWKQRKSNFEPITPQVALLHMLYHGARISLNSSFVARDLKQAESKTSSHDTRFANSKDVCIESADAIVSILQSFRVEHSLRNAPLTFVTTTIMAINAILVTTRKENLTFGDKIRTLESALKDLACTWSLADEARTKFQNVLCLRKAKQRDHDDERNNQVARGIVLRMNESQPSFESVPEDATTSHIYNFELDDKLPLFGDTTSPEMTLWDPLTLMDDEVAYWSSMQDILVTGGIDMQQNDEN